MITKTKTVVNFSGNSAPRASDVRSRVSFLPSFVQKPIYTKPIEPVVHKRKHVPNPAVLSIDYQDPLPVEHKNVPSFVKATFTDDIDIIKIHGAIKATFEHGLYNLNNMKLKIEELSNNLRGDSLSLIDAEKIGSQIDTITNKINNLESMEEWHHYVDKVKPVLDKYLPLASDETMGIVVFSSMVKVEDPEVVEKRLDIIEKYIKIASFYISMDVTSKTKNSTNCPGCDCDTSDHVDVCEGILVCECGYQQINVIKHSTFKDANRVNVSGRSDYDDRTTFIKALDCFSGIKTSKIPDLLFVMLDEYFVNRGFPSGEEIKNTRKLLPNGKKEGTNNELLVTALAETNNANYYSQANCIAVTYWGWVLPDVSHLRDKVIFDYEATQKVYNEFKERESSLNVHIRMYLHYTSLGCNFKKSDFKIPTSPDSLTYHDKMWRIMCEKAETEINYIPFL
jgi:hypothetical protein